MKANLWIDKLNFKNGTSISLQKNSIVVFVGPNNSGKSLVLREIDWATNGRVQKNLIIDNVSVKAEGSIDDFLKKIEHRLDNDIYKHYNSNSNAGMHANTLKTYWEDALKGNHLKKGAPAVANFFVKPFDTATRLNLVAPATNIDVMTELKTHPIHELKQSTEKEKVFSEFFNDAFGEDIIVNHGAGGKIPLHVGKRPIVTAENDRVSSDYQADLRKLPLLHEQGDGMKSFAGVFLSLFIENFSINLVDEPEAFLHPPQATLLGKMIGQKLGIEKQVFLSTHSEDLIKGLLETAVERLLIVRIHRVEGTNNLDILGSKDILNVWNNTLLRHSNIIDGLFHKKVVVAESDSDCRFYNAVTSAVEKELKLPSQDVLFVPGHGKDRFPVIIRALKALAVPLIIIGDFDLYHDENPTRKIYEELGGTWNDIKADFFKVKRAIDQKLPELKTEDLKQEIDRIFASFDDRVIPDNKIKLIQSALKKASPWRQAKASGKAYLPSGEVMLAFNRTQQRFAEKNLFVLELGEIEAFDKTVDNHGPKWVNKVLEKDIISSTEFESARIFVRDNILNFKKLSAVE